MFTLHELIGKTFDEIKELFHEYNQNHDEKIHFVISKINNNVKFVKHIHSKYIYYIHIQINDEEISSKFNDILLYPYENERRHHSATYFSEVIKNPENMKKCIVSSIYQK